MTIGFLACGGDLHLFDERRFLNFARRKIVVIVEADFAHGQHLGMREQIGQAFEIVRARFRGIMRMNADCGVKCRVFLGEPETGFQIGRTVAGTDRQHVLDAGGECALDHGLAIFVEFGAVQVAVGVNETHLRRAPTGTSSRKPASTGLPPSSDAATIMPFDSMPRNFRGWRFATITTLRPTICFGRVRFGDAGDDGPRLFFADVHLHVQKFVGAFHSLGADHLADAQVHFHEIVDARFWLLGRQSGLAASLSGAK